MAEPKTREWPLIAFTVGLQLAAGLELSTVFALRRLAEPAAPLRTLAISVFPITLIAIAASLFHLGRPMSAWRAFTNLGQSGLSREVLICSAFGASAFAQFVLCHSYGILPPALALVTAILGIAAVIASARIYTVPAQPLWNSGWVTASFLGSTLLLGGIATKVLVGTYSSGIMVASGAVVLLASSIVMLTEILRIANRRYVNPGSLPIMETKHWLSFGGLVLGTVLPAVGLIFKNGDDSIAFATAIIAIVGVALGRALMYSRGIALARF